MNNQKELIPMQPGDLLRYQREQAGLTLERVSQLARIKPSLLQAIERGETEEIPTVYLRGYIRAYAKALGVDPSDIEERMAHVKGSEPVVQSVLSVPSVRGRTEKWLKASSYLAASAVIAALAWQFTHEAVRFSQGDSQLTATDIAPAASGDSSQGGHVAQPRTPGTHLSASIASVEVMQQRGARGSASAAEQAWAAISEQDGTVEEVVESGLHHLTVKTSADSWVEIFDGQGAQLELDLIRAGQERSYGGSAPFQVMLGRASAVELTLDGDSVDLAPYTRGNVARLTLGAEATADSSEAVDSARR